MAKRIIPFFIVCASLCGCAMKVEAAAEPAQEVAAPVFSTYLGEQLTSESLPLLAPSLPAVELAKIKSWLNSPTLFRLNPNGPIQEGPLRKQIIKGLVTLKWPLAGITSNFAQQQQGINHLLQLQGMPNMSQWNYIFALPKMPGTAGMEYAIQFAGVLNRVKNLLVYNDPMVPGMQPLQDRTPDVLCDSAIKKEHATYQTVSRVAHYLRAKEAIDKFGLDAIAIPDTFLIGIDKDVPVEATDDNSIVVQERVVDLIAVREMAPRAVATIPVEALRQILILTVYAGLWDLRANLLFDARNGQLVVTDFEQPNNSNPIDFFHKKEAKALGNIRCGINQINELFSKDSRPEVKAICQKFMQMKDEDLKAIGAGQLPEGVKVLQKQ